MDALILAAGRGTRMGTLEKPKCLLDIGGTNLIDYQIKCLKNVGIKKIFVVTGYNSELIKEHLTNQVSFLHNPKFATTNNLYSFWIANEILQNDFVCLYADLLFHQQILQNCVNNLNNICLVIEKNIRHETMRARIKENRIVEVNKIIPTELASGNFIGMAKFSKESISSLLKEISNLINQDNNLYYTSAIESMIKNGYHVGYTETNGLPWLDIDEKHEFEEAKQVYHTMIENSF